MLRESNQGKTPRPTAVDQRPGMARVEAKPQGVPPLFMLKVSDRLSGISGVAAKVDRINTFFSGLHAGNLLFYSAESRFGEISFERMQKEKERLPREIGETSSEYTIVDLVTHLVLVFSLEAAITNVIYEKLSIGQSVKKESEIKNARIAEA